jgi:hypothetical protein
MYVEGLGFKLLGEFENHNGCDGKIIGHEQHGWHLEFTHHTGTLAGRAPTQDHLLVFYIPDAAQWQASCSDMLAAEFKQVEPYNPYWASAGATFEDIDGYRVVLQNGNWAV